MPVIKTPLRVDVALFCLLLALQSLSLPARAQQQDDTRRILEQRNQAQAKDRERAIIKDEVDADRPTMVVDGREYTVEHNANDVGRALYLALQNKQWSAVRYFLDEYLTLPDRDPLLVHYAQGAVARLAGDYARAEREYRALLQLKPDFLPGRLELARVLFEDQQNKEAGALFGSIESAIDRNDPKTEGVLGSISSFRQALAARDGWQGSAALGPAWSDNVNRTSASSNCLVFLGGQCYFNRSTPEAVKSAGYEFDAGLDRRWTLSGHHGLYLRSTLFGQGYRDHSAFNELTSTTQAGYSYRSGRHAFALAPSFEYYALGNAALYGAGGLHTDWSWTISPVSLLKIEGDWKQMRYRRQDYASYLDGDTGSAYATYFRGFGERLTAFVGIDALDSKAQDDADGYFQRGVRVGGSLQWLSGFQATLFTSYRWRDYGAFSSILEARRKDKEQGYTLILRAPRLAFSGFVPLLTLRRNQIESNVDWLYSYDRNAISLKFEHQF